MISRISFFVFAIITFAVLTGDKPVKSQAASRAFNGFELADKTGKFLRKPADYRDHYEILGTWCSIRSGTKCTSPTSFWRHSCTLGSDVNWEYSCDPSRAKDVFIGNNSDGQ